MFLMLVSALLPGLVDAVPSRRLCGPREIFPATIWFGLRYNFESCIIDTCDVVVLGGSDQGSLGLFCALIELVGARDLNCGGPAVVALAAALESSENLSEIELNGVLVGDDGAVALARVLHAQAGSESQGHGIKELRLDGADIGSIGATHLAAAIQDGGPLRIMRLERNRIGPTGAAAFGKVLGSPASALSQLWLGGNGIGAEGARMIATGLGQNRKLRRLHLGSNDVSADGATALASALKGPTSLSELDLSNNLIGDAGAGSLAAALEINTVMSTLFLGVNWIGDAGAKLFAKALQTNQRLTTLDLRFNRIGEAGESAIAAAIQRNVEAAVKKKDARTRAKERKEADAVMKKTPTSESAQHAEL